GAIVYLFVLKGANKVTDSRIMRTIIASALVTLLASIFNLIKIGNLDMVIIGSIFPLIPGVPFTNSVRSFLEDDYLTGVIRLVDAVLVTMCIAAGVFITLKFVSFLVGGGIL
ncbi:MAG: threonine/serine exporter family protein, partial [Intestinibacter sp.]|uniref:threonine/serine exporter family protein n=1 Tax=Intestinibacter sp. TaxID=1965304 RepID=UPI003F1393FD